MDWVHTNERGLDMISEGEGNGRKEQGRSAEVEE